MREKILEAIYKKIEEEPENKNLQKQIVLLMMPIFPQYTHFA